MGSDLISFRSTQQDSLEIFKDTFLVPSNWKSRGPVVYISGAPGLSESRPVAAVLTEDTLSLCSSDGPIYSLPVGAIQDVKVENITGISFPIQTPSGVTRMIPPSASGVVVSFKLTPSGAVGRLILFTLSPDAAYVWTNDIQTAMQSYSSKNFGFPERK